MLLCFLAVDEKAVASFYLAKGVLQNEYGRSNDLASSLSSRRSLMFAANEQPAAMQVITGSAVGIPASSITAGCVAADIVVASVAAYAQVCNISGSRVLSRK